MKMKTVSLLTRWLTRLALVALLVGLTTSARAAAKTWIGSTDVNWNTGGNWNLGTVPANSDSATFNAAGTAGTALNNNIPGPVANPIGNNYNG
ncbi:MAG: hypothetical protein NTZ16_13030, partial [Verrucomicrobia bacterium]|nr:hypothetical protein [Verrucomicrobiota bacterium]